MSQWLIEPAKHDKRGPLYSRRSIHNYCLKMIVSGTYFEDKGKTMKTDIDAATEIVDKATERFDFSLERMLDSCKRVSEETKQISGKVRDTTQKLSDGLLKIEKQANFDRLERYVSLLERAEKAISSLAELEASGRLQKIAGAIK